jgi:hypothetical protein
MANSLSTQPQVRNDDAACSDITNYCILLIIVFLPAASAAQESQALELIQVLTYASDRPGKEAVMLGMFSCGANEDLAIAKQLLKLGVTAIPDLEAAIGSIANKGERSEFSYNGQLLPLIYAHIRGNDAYDRLDQLARSPGITSLGWSLDSAIAISQSITARTSVVKAMTSSGRIFHCRGEEPRDALNRLISGWLQNDPQRVAESLGPSASSVLRGYYSQSGRWTSLRGRLGPLNFDSYEAVGYRFEAAGAWSVPDGILDAPGLEVSINSISSARSGLETTFVSRSGRECGRLRVSFDRVPNGRFVVNSTRIVELLGLISTCAVAR